MTGFRARPVSRSLASAALVVIALSGMAVVEAVMSNRASAEAEPTPLHRPIAGATPDRPPPAGFTFEPLKAPDVGGVGILDDRHGGLGADLWKGTPRALVTKLLPALPVRSPSPVLHQLMRRLLLTAAIPPADSDGTKEILHRRIERLWALGEVADMLRLIESLPAEAVDASLWRYRLNGLLLQGGETGVCAQLPAARKDDADGYFSELSAFCAALAGRTAEAAGTAAWLRDHGLGDDAFFAGLEAMIGTRAGLTSLAHPRPLHLAMARAAKLPLPADAASGTQPAILQAVATDPSTPLEVRLIAAEKAERMGVLDPAILRHVYSTVTFSESEAERPVDDAASPSGWRSRALLFRVAETQESAPAQAELISKALRLAQQRGQFGAAARLYAPLIAAMSPTPALSGFAGTAIRALLAAGHKGAIAPWLPLCPPASSQAGINLVWPLLRLMDAHEDDPPPPGQLLAWLSQRAPQEPELARQQAALLFGLLDALGDKVRTEDWLALMDGPMTTATTMPPPALWHAQRIAAEQLRSGETVLLALVSLGMGFPNEIDPTVVYRVVASLRLVGFDEEARAIAVEAALAHGV